MCSKKEITLLALLTVSAQPSLSPWHASRQSRSSATSCIFWMLSNGGQKDAGAQLPQFAMEQRTDASADSFSHALLRVDLNPHSY